MNAWNDEGWKEPEIEERFEPDRTILTLEFVKKTSEEKIIEYLEENGESTTNEIAEYLHLSTSRTRAILSGMENVEKIGANTNRSYALKK